MPRLRTLKPEFFTHEVLAELSPLHRLLYAGLWCHADREGRLKDRPRYLRTVILPYDDCDVEALLVGLQSRGFIVRYEVGGIRYIAIPTFPEHQKPHPREAASEIPAPPEGGNTKALSEHNLGGAASPPGPGPSVAKDVTSQVVFGLGGFCLGDFGLGLGAAGLGAKIGLASPIAAAGLEGQATPPHPAPEAAAAGEDTSWWERWQRVRRVVFPEDARAEVKPFDGALRHWYAKACTEAGDAEALERAFVRYCLSNFGEKQRQPGCVRVFMQPSVWTQDLAPRRGRCSCPREHWQRYVGGREDPPHRPECPTGVADRLEADVSQVLADVATQGVAA